MLLPPRKHKHKTQQLSQRDVEDNIRGMKEEIELQFSVCFIPVVDGLSSRGQRGLGFGERGAAVVAAAAVDWAGPGHRDRGVGRQAGKEGGRGRRRNRLREVWLQVFLLTSLQPRHPWSHH